MNTIKKMQEEYKMEMEVHLENSGYINPLSVFESFYFHKKTPAFGNKQDYRTLALDRCFDERISFSATENNDRNMAGKLIRITCPECNEDMKAYSTGRWKCRCGNEFSMDISHMSFEFSHKNYFKVGYKDDTTEDDKEKGLEVVSIFAILHKEDDEEEVVAKLVKNHKSQIFSDKFLVTIKYLNSRAKTDEKVEELCQKLFEELSFRE